MIANCPSCGTHYRHEAPRGAFTARCGRCDTALVLSALRPYRIVRRPPPTTTSDAHRVASYATIGLDDPALASTIARRVEPGSAPPHILLREARPVPVRIPASRPEPPKTPALPPMPLDVAPTEVAESPAIDPAPRPMLADPHEPPPQPPPARYGDDAVSFWLWVATFAMAGTSVSWAMDGTTPAGLAWGVATGAVLWWGWRQWNSPK